MSLDQIEAKVLELPADERRQFARWFYDHEQSIFSPPTEEVIDPGIRAEILRRRDELRNNPGLAIPVTDEWLNKLKQRFSSAPASKTPVA
jgi:hypothetical protein